MCCSSHVLLCDTGFCATSLETEAIKIQILCAGGHFMCGGWQGGGQKGGNGSPKPFLFLWCHQPRNSLGFPHCCQMLLCSLEKTRMRPPCKRSFLQTGAKVSDHIPSLCPCCAPTKPGSFPAGRGSSHCLFPECFPQERALW